MPPKRPPEAGLEAAVGGAPAGVVDPLKLNGGFAGVAALPALPNNAPGCELGVPVTVGVEALLPNNPPDESAFVADDKVFAVLVGVVVELPNNPPEEAGLPPPPNMLELDVAVWEAPPKSPPAPPVGVVVDDPNSDGFCSVVLLVVFPNKFPPVLDDVEVGLLLLLLLLFVLPKENPVAAGVVDCPPKRPGEDVPEVDVPNRPAEEGALLVVALLDCPEELAPKLKDMIASVCRGIGVRVVCLRLWNAMIQIIGGWRLRIVQSSSDTQASR